MTSLRWLASDRKSSANKFAAHDAKGGLFEEDEFFDAGSTKTKFVSSCFSSGTPSSPSFRYPCAIQTTTPTPRSCGSRSGPPCKGAVYYIDVFSDGVERLQIAEEFENEPR